MIKKLIIREVNHLKKKILLLKNSNKVKETNFLKKPWEINNSKNSSQANSSAAQPNQQRSTNKHILLI